mmetsp:Transcript_26983/g.50417  ORF Transcript_26983/g.50417 Transcript_26983/m.50417 type:complete len:179 (+) Transcript_26983:46-582(+)|eukprot:CAMPEP_0114438578 /NCGR_PEP_ID=MMETSP0103-20121206/14695_1 /TAXON_ID=37642 ORGANISM="Paraphysomonas imperforata, Strain PA2" /NCGR_SAMPLE_ID=MMETSP0103 /ASSEMBLY_ACC=CAM_ASM_000201 /LENGTH=178 /DNA_ID=CAMNT_0001609193 /DNA_START=21 /DNA_END=557 /DNA_ORIENTATION=+
MPASSSTSLKSVETLLKLVILPSESEKPMDAVKAQLNNMLFSYNEDLDGVPMVYYDIKLPPGKEYGRILNDSPWLHIDILVKLLLFQPTRGLIATGQINKLTDSHISLLVHGVFNVTISETELQSRNYSYNESTNSWDSDQFSFSEGDYMEFRTLSCQQSYGVFFLDGSPIQKCEKPL